MIFESYIQDGGAYGVEPDQKKRQGLKAWLREKGECTGKVGTYTDQRGNTRMDLKAIKIGTRLIHDSFKIQLLQGWAWCELLMHPARWGHVIGRVSVVDAHDGRLEVDVEYGEEKYEVHEDREDDWDYVFQHVSPGLTTS